MSTPSSPGWYENPDNPDELRYFDGILWTANTTPLRTRQPQPPAATPPSEAPEAPHSGQAPYGQTPPGQAPYGQAPPGQYPPQAPHQPGPPAGWGPPHGQQPGQAPTGWPPAPGAAGPQEPQLAPYFFRVVAYLVDTILISVASLILGGFFLWKAIEPIADRLDSILVSGDVAAMGSILADAELGWLAAFLGVQLLILLAYNVFFLVKWGATPGKMMLGISVRRVDRPGPLDTDTAIRRAGFMAVVQALGNIPYIATFGSMLLIADFVWPIADQRNQALHDKVARTIVIKGRAVR